MKSNLARKQREMKQDYSLTLMYNQNFLQSQGEYVNHNGEESNTLHK